MEKIDESKIPLKKWKRQSIIENNRNYKTMKNTRNMNMLPKKSLEKVRVVELSISIRNWCTYKIKGLCWPQLLFEIFDKRYLRTNLLSFTLKNCPYSFQLQNIKKNPN